MAQKIIERGHVGEVLQHIYTSELNINITLFTEGGYFYLGHNEKKSALRGTTIEEVVTHLGVRISNEFPASGFASWWRLNFKQDDLS
jgi:hypothetical protein